eukprot:135693_1
MASTASIEEINSADLLHPISTNPKWSDITPIKQDDGPGVVSIAYSLEFTETMNYFRAILHKDERSERALLLTEAVINVNPADYSAWHFRRLCLKSIGSDLYEELKFIVAIGSESPKNYQLWFHRRKVVEWLKDPSQELMTTERVLENDTKNYHAWSHRLWANQHFDMWDNELSFTEKLIENDIRNNSAWNHRYTVIKSTSGFTSEVIEREERFVCDRIKKCPSNESSWNYLRGLLNVCEPTRHENLRTFTEDIISNQDPECVHGHAFLVDLLMKYPNDVSKSQEASKICDKLAAEIDIIRCSYWNFVKESIAN